ncbi:MAG: hypothetical protein SGCHY_005047 [Lobulomycetales sp.]
MPQWSDKDEKTLKSTKFPAILSKPIDTSKIQVDALRPWVERTIKNLLGVDDEIAAEYVFELLAEPAVDGRKMCVSLQGFLEAHTAAFVTSLWTMLLSAQSESTGVPKQVMEEKRKEMQQMRPRRMDVEDVTGEASADPPEDPGTLEARVAAELIVEAKRGRMSGNVNGGGLPLCRRLRLVRRRRQRVRPALALGRLIVNVNGLLIKKSAIVNGLLMEEIIDGNGRQMEENASVNGRQMKKNADVNGRQMKEIIDVNGRLMKKSADVNGRLMKEIVDVNVRQMKEIISVNVRQMKEVISVNGRLMKEILSVNVMTDADNACGPHRSNMKKMIINRKKREKFVKVCSLSIKESFYLYEYICEIKT